MKRLSKPETWEQIERFLTQNTVRAYDLAVEQVRLDATTISGHHLISESSLFQFGHSKDHPNLPQVKLMMGMIDPLGMPLVTQVVSGGATRFCEVAKLGELGRLGRLGKKDKLSVFDKF